MQNPREEAGIKLEHHVVTSFAAAFCAYVVFRSLAAAGGILVGGVLIDIDHFLDYFLHRGMRLDIRELCHLSYNNLFPKLFLILHSYELLVLTWAAYLLGIRNYFFLGCAIGFTIHIFLDQVFNYSRPLSYFFTYRLIKGFEAEHIHSPGAKGKPIKPIWRRGG